MKKAGRRLPGALNSHRCAVENHWDSLNAAAMPLIEELSRLQKEHAEGKLSEAALQESLRRLVDNEGAGDPAHLQDEFTKLRREAAINGLDREFEEIRKECLIYYKGRFSEPSVHKFWGHLWAVVFLIGLFVAVSVPVVLVQVPPSSKKSPFTVTDVAANATVPVKLDFK